MAGPDDLTTNATEEFRFKATGPNQGFSVFGLSGFYTFANSFNYGVNAQGNRAGIYGECLRSNQDTDREADIPGIGVYGYGDGFGVYGNGNPGLAGVLGTNNKGKVGVIGAAMDERFNGQVTRSGTGIFGASVSSLGNPLNTFQSIPPSLEPIQLGSGTGVFGLSGKGKGVYGTSIEGIGGEFESVNERGIYCHSMESRGGEFECASGRKSQLRLVPAQRPDSYKLPKEGKVGDIMLLRHIYFDGETNRDECSLWLCIPNLDSFPQGSEESDKWQEIRLGQVVLGDL